MTDRVLEIYLTLKNEIVALQLEPGQMISENELSKRFNTSRTTIRRVLQRLQMEKLIDIYPQRGSFVSNLDYERIKSVIYMRFLVEKDIMLRICQSLSPEIKLDLDHILKLQEHIIQQGGNFAEQFYKMDAEFHKTCFLAEGKGQVWDVLENLEFTYTRLRRLDYKINGTIEQLYTEHRTIYEYLCRNQPQELVDAIQKHLYGNLVRVEETLTNRNWIGSG